MSCTKLQLPPDRLTRGGGGYGPHIPVLCPQLNLLNTPPHKIPGYATGRMKPQVQIDRDRERERERFAYSLHVIVREIIYSGRRIFLLLRY